MYYNISFFGTLILNMIKSSNKKMLSHTMTLQSVLIGRVMPFRHQLIFY